MPKQRITKETVVDAAFEIARASGMEQVLVKNIAEKIGCSVQPIYSYCRNMDGLRQEVVAKTTAFIRAFVATHGEGDDPFAKTGRAYLQLAREEPNLFKIFILHPRKGVASLEDLYRSETDPDMAKRIAAGRGLTLAQARQLHLQMLIYTVGMGTIFAVTDPGISPDEIYRQQENAYRAFLGQIVRGEGEQE